MDKLAKQVSRYILLRAEKEWETLIGDDGDILPDEDALINYALEEALDWLADEMRFDRIVQQAIQEARHIVRESAEDAAAYTRDPLGYHGLRFNDFI